MTNSKAFWLGIGLSLAVVSSAWGDESGFIQNGKAHVVYRDGEKVGKTPQELGGGRKPAAYSQGQGLIFYQKHGDVTCYYTTNEASLQCMK